MKCLLKLHQLFGLVARNKLHLLSSSPHSPGVAVEGQVEGSVVQSVFLDENNIWEAVSMDGARLPAL